MHKIRIGILQMTSTNNIKHNMDFIRRGSLLASKKKVKIQFQPENCHYMGSTVKDSLEIAKQYDELVEVYGNIAQANNVC